MGDQWDAVVIGGGPAGAATAITIQQYGYRALVLEAGTFPRHHVGESLIDLWGVLARLGVAEEMDATMQHKHGSCRIWGSTPALHWTSFDYVRGPRKYSLQVERSLFDQILLRRAAAVGADVRQGHRVTAVLWEGERAVGVRYRDPAGEEHDAHARLVVDAGGRSSLIGRDLGLRRADPFYPDLSVYGYYAGATRFDGDQAGHLFIEAVPAGWFWYIPLHTGEVSVGLVCDRTSRPRLRQVGAATFLAEAVAGSTMVRELLAEATLVNGPIVTASDGYQSARYAGPGWLLAGDTGFFIDPMWATGVGNALSDGLLAGAVLETVASGRVTEADAVAFYDRHVGQKAAAIDTIVKFVYRSNQLHTEHPFWQRRHSLLAAQPMPLEDFRRIAGQQWGTYFRAAIAGMGVDPALLATFDHGLEEIERRGAGMERVAHDPTDWAPALAPAVVARRGIDVEGSTGRIVPGLELEHGVGRLFISDRHGIAAFEAVDGRRTLRQIIAAVLAAADPRERLGIHFRLVAGFAYARGQGLIEARSMAETLA